jgi:hypothetical protein
LSLPPTNACLSVIFEVEDSALKVSINVQVKPWLEENTTKSTQSLVPKIKPNAIRKKISIAITPDNLNAIMYSRVFIQPVKAFSIACFGWLS